MTCMFLNKFSYCMEYYKDSYSISKDEIDDIYLVFKNLIPLIKDINVDIRIVNENETTANRGAEYAILFYSEKKDNYLQNIGFIGEQLDLYLVDKNIGTLWYGAGKTKDLEYNGLSYVTMMLICKVPNDSFRKDMFKSKRKSLDEIWNGNKYLDIANIVRFTPSSCNTQPWKIEEKDNTLEIYRYRKEGKRGIMPNNKIIYQNLIDIGIFLCFMIIVLEYNNYSYEYEIYFDDENNQNELNLDFKINNIYKQ